MSEWIEQVGENEYRVHFPGELNARYVQLGGWDSPSCDGRECDGDCAHIDAVELVANYDDADEPLPLVWEKLTS